MVSVVSVIPSSLPLKRESEIERERTIDQLELTTRSAAGQVVEVKRRGRVVWLNIKPGIPHPEEWRRKKQKMGWKKKVRLGEMPRWGEISDSRRVKTICYSRRSNTTNLLTKSRD